MNGEEPFKAPLAIYFIFITVLLNMIGYGIIMPVMPDLVMEVTGGDVSEAARWGGYLTLGYAAMQFLMMPIMGGLSDRFGRKPVLLVSLAAFSLDFLVMALAPTIMLILIARMAAGAFAATFSTANAYIADVSPPEKRAGYFGMMGAAFGLGFIIGPGLGGIIGEHFGPRAPFYTVAIIGAANFLFGYFVLPETLSEENRRPFHWRRANALGNIIQFRRYPVILPIALSLFLYQIAHWSFPSVWAYFAKEKFSWGAQEIGWSLMFVGLCAALVQGGLTRHAVARFGERACALFGFGIGTMTYIAYAFAPTPGVIYVLIAISALAGFVMPSIQGIMSRTMPANAQGELQGAVATVSSLAMAISPVLMTQVFYGFTKPDEPFRLFGLTILPQGTSVYFPGAPFLLAGVIVVIALFPLFVAFSRIRRPREESAVGN